MGFQTEVWREACRYIEITDVVGRVAALLSRRLPLEHLIIRRLDTDRGRLETLAAHNSHSDTPPAPVRTSQDATAIRQIEAWCRQGELLVGTLADPLVNLLAPSGLEGTIAACPLVYGGGNLGVLLVAFRPGKQPSATHLEIVVQLKEPFVVALENAYRFRELATQRAAIEADNRALLSRLGRQEIVDSIVGSEAGLKDVMAGVDQVSHTDAPVLILGETGSGKEVVARAIHARSRRAGGPFERVNCGAIPSGLVDSELFGHERGSFTGAVNARKGWFERADGGTLFLDEVAELPAAAQVRLLRILQDGTFERVGGQKSLKVDVRIVAATHEDMQAMVAAGTFREDLWYRISVFPIVLPPLRDRVEDLPALAAHFAWKAGMRLGGAPLSPSPEDLELLLAYSWPGNVRELAAVIERAAILGDGHRLHVARALGGNNAANGKRGAAEPGQVGGRVIPARAVEPEGTRAPAAAEQPVGSTGSTFQSLDDAIRTHIKRALERTGGQIEGPRGAAALLDINPHTLRAKMRKLEVDWGAFRG